MDHAQTTRFAWIIGSMFLIACGIYGYIVYLPWNFDDGMIVARIVRNIIDGHGWVYNVGEYLNASTSVLHTVLVTAVALVTNDIPTALHIVGGLSITVASFCIWRIISPHLGDTPGILIGALLSYSLIHNYTWGLEGYLFIALFLLFILREQQNKDTWILLGLLILARPDAILVLLLKCARVILEKKPLGVGLLKTAFVILPWAIFSLYTFHQLFPNTLSNKVWQGRSGMWGHGPIYLKALVKQIIASPWWQLVLCIFAPFGAWIAFQKRSALIYLALFAGAQQCAYIILNVPGYHWYFSNLFSAIVVFGCIGVFSFIASRAPDVLCALSSNRTVGFHSILGTSLIIYFSLTTLPVTDARDVKYSQATKEIEAAQLGSGSLGTLEVGSIGYHSPRYIVDLTGLTSKNPEFITGKNTELFFNNAPTFLLLHSPPWHFERAILDDIRFELMYEPVSSTPNPAHGLALFRRNATSSLAPEEVRKIIADRYKPARKMPPEEVTPCDDSCLCIIDYLNGQFTSQKEIRSKRTIVRARGWGVEIDKADTGSFPELILKGDHGIFAVPGIREARPDVATHLKRSELQNAGVVIEGHVLDLPPGNYDVLLAQKRGVQLRSCSTTVKLILD